MRYLILLSFLFSFSACKVQYHLQETEHSKYDITNDSNIEADSEITNLIAPYKKQLDEKMNEVIGYCEKELTKEKTAPEFTLGNWAADAIYAESNKYSKKPIDFAIVNTGGIRIPSLAQGDVTTGKIFELMPFDNMLVILRVKGDIVQQLFENIAARGGWPVSKGVVCSFTTDGILKSVSIHGEKIDTDKTYLIGISDYVANGGDKCSFFKGQPFHNTGVLFRDAFIHYVKDQTRLGKKLNAVIEGRMLVE